MISHEAKGARTVLEETHITPAYGIRMWPKLVAQVDSSKRAVRVSALLVLCEELRNPANMIGCIESGVVGVLNVQISSDPDPLTRYHASKALIVCALDANGRNAMLVSNTIEAMRSAMDDAEDAVRRHVYKALVELSTGNVQGVRALIAAQYPAALVGKAAHEVVGLQPLVLELLCNCLSNDDGLEAALGNSAIETCLMLLQHPATAVRSQATRTLNRLCLTEIAKKIAIEAGAVRALVFLIKDPERLIRSAAMGALMALTTTDQGKRAMVSCESISLLIDLLHEGHNILTINTLKCIANVAVHPKIQEQLRDSKDCLGTLAHMSVHDNELISKHACIAQKAILWEP
mmetsp:Transcript_27973/g.86519  ORF Transcript_27973/g.86519 Transcript_27973/m.86519 type:complete len:347 (-) Transcript_27973:285-1325(-)